MCSHLLLVEYPAGVVFFTQKTAYELRISDWSSDVCSSDLRRAAWAGPPAESRKPKECSGSKDSRATRAPHDRRRRRLTGRTGRSRRSEEHTSEIQSLMRISYAVFCLTKKKTGAS